MCVCVCEQELEFAPHAAYLAYRLISHGLLISVDRVYMSDVRRQYYYYLLHTQARLARGSCAGVCKVRLLKITSTLLIRHTACASTKTVQWRELLLVCILQNKMDSHFSFRSRRLNPCLSDSILITLLCSEPDHH